VNQKGGLLGRSVEFVIDDNGSDEKTAVRLYEKLITEDKVDAVIKLARVRVDLGHHAAGMAISRCDRGRSYLDPLAHPR